MHRTETTFRFGSVCFVSVCCVAFRFVCVSVRFGSFRSVSVRFVLILVWSGPENTYRFPCEIYRFPNVIYRCLEETYRFPLEMYTSPLDV